MIEVRNLTKSYGDTRGVKNISFDVAQGEILGFLGPNGAGKTTTMRVITGYLPPTSGSVKVAGYDVFEQALKVKKHIGYLPENPPLYGDMTVKAYLKYVGELKHVYGKELKSELGRVIEVAGLESVQGRLIANISKGFKQRVGIAQALLGDPPVLILDEPTVGLDPRQIIEIRQLIKTLGEHHTVILSSHILPEVNAICERVVIINEGELMAVDTPEGLAGQLLHSQRVLVRIKGEADEIEKVLALIPTITKVELRTSRHGESTYLIESSLETDIREELFYKMAEADLPILEMRPENLSLEEVFVQLTTEEAEVMQSA